MKTKFISAQLRGICTFCTQVFIALKNLPNDFGDIFSQNTIAIDVWAQCECVALGNHHADVKIISPFFALFLCTVKACFVA